MAGLPAFTRFVRSVQGYSVARYGADAAALIGAKRRALTPAQRKARECPIVWDTERIVALTDEYCRRYRRELDGAIRRGELIECKREDWEAQRVRPSMEMTEAQPPKRKASKEANQ